MKKKKVAVWMILHVWSGLLEDNEPFITSSKREVFKKLKSVLQEDFGFRAAHKGESMDNYLAAFRAFEYKYRNEYSSVTDEEEKENISNSQEWNTVENELLFHQGTIEL